MLNFLKICVIFHSSYVLRFNHEIYTRWILFSTKGSIEYFTVVYSLPQDVQKRNIGLLLLIKGAKMHACAMVRDEVGRNRTVSSDQQDLGYI